MPGSVSKFPTVDLVKKNHPNPTRTNLKGPIDNVFSKVR